VYKRQWYDSNNISGTKVAEMGFDGELYISNYNNQVSIYANDNARWQFTNDNNGQMVLPHGAILSDGSSNSILLGYGVQQSGYSQRVVIGYQPDGQTGESWDAIAIGSRAGTTNQNNNAIALGNRAGNSNQGNDAIAIGSSPNSSVGGAGYSNQGQYAVAIGAQAGETSQANNSIALGYQAAQISQGYKSVAIGDLAGNDTQGFLSVAIGANAGLDHQANSAVAVGHSAGRVSQSADSVAVGNIAGENSQGYGAVAVGQRAGENSQNQNAIAIGSYAGNTGQGLTAIAIGENAADTNQGFSAIALGRWAGEDTQGQKAIAIGRLAGRFNQSGWAVAIGHHAGMGISGTSYQGVNAIAIGAHAGEYSQHDNSIVLQATANGNGTGINPDQAGLFIDPIRNVNSGSQFVIYNSDTKEVTYNATNIEIDGSVITATNATTDANVILEPLGAGYVSASNAQIKHVAEPTDDNDAATKYYVDAARSGLDVKQSVRLATTGNISLSGEQLIDTIMAVAGDRVLVKDQDDHTLNGIYVVVAGDSWIRATDFDQNTEVTSGAFTFVEDGDVNLNAGFVVTTKVVDIGVTAIDWTLFSASGTLIAGDGLSKSGYTLAVNTNSSTGGIEISDDSLQLKSSLAGDGLTYTDGVLSLTGTTDRITIGTHTVDIASTYVGQSSITTLGTIGTGVWNGTTIDSGYGGTGFSTYAKGDMIYASDTNTLSKLTGGDDGKILQMNASGVPVWGDIDGGTY